MDVKVTDNRDEVFSKSKEALTPEIVAFIEDCTQKQHPNSHLINVLHKVQGHFGYLGKEQLDAVAQLLQVPTAKVTGVATFYHFFRLEPRGRFVINICLGTACYVKGAERVCERLCDELGIHVGETTPDGMFSLEGTRCVGTCGLAPVVLVNDTVFGEVTPDQIPALIESHIKKAQAMEKESVV
ncbi:MAG TPA: NADH-quinone oxidoreductase subunit NuoE [Candidatus Hydrogenedentes bacterium]|jgi:NADH:ubiquinone oxidoreductase subunit E|nr:MAG: NADP-reducing hydrogenase subunit HndA [Candidatus Hydrogenedentes bacterium ADurb.Bin170]HNZ48430.1 NADH-quinone oxidoreductase subunit NuoE [Candidatus Hydrogenedentota bacterium]HOD95719.1 NADH-quinone oxidoreductase subunit NuoE [Candidatus Hydrogenedentota bacterium]HOM48817.1 NADH-quinone oxidoreductase subunit NuoE [Candidatus Hydrogenedentota bacterium]HOR51113.1 NADH-quinone oxidoreductase subunit NuoE [Candidatus Hydrogenedentota bacterium]